MREIKFRVWDNLDFMSQPFTLQDLQEKKIQFTSECILMQYTGIKDKNGKEIYEGDILSDPFPIDYEDLSKGYHEGFLPVIWCPETLQWCVDASFAKDGSYPTSMVEYFGNHLEVKGNIHENPELL